LVHAPMTLLAEAQQLGGPGQGPPGAAPQQVAVAPPATVHRFVSTPGAVSPRMTVTRKLLLASLPPGGASAAGAPLLSVIAPPTPKGACRTVNAGTPVIGGRLITAPVIVPWQPEEGSAPAAMVALAPLAVAPCIISAVSTLDGVVHGRAYARPGSATISTVEGPRLQVPYIAATAPGTEENPQCADAEGPLQALCQPRVIACTTPCTPIITPRVTVQARVEEAEKMPAAELQLRIPQLGMPQQLESTLPFDGFDMRPAHADPAMVLTVASPLLSAVGPPQPNGASVAMSIPSGAAAPVSSGQGVPGQVTTAEAVPVDGSNSVLLTSATTATGAPLELNLHEKLFDEDWWYRHLEERRQGGAPPDRCFGGAPGASAARPPTLVTVTTPRQVVRLVSSGRYQFQMLQSPP